MGVNWGSSTMPLRRKRCHKAPPLQALTRSGRAFVRSRTTTAHAKGYNPAKALPQKPKITRNYASLETNKGRPWRQPKELVWGPGACASGDPDHSKDTQVCCDNAGAHNINPRLELGKGCQLHTAGCRRTGTKTRAQQINPRATSHKGPIGPNQGWS